MFDQFLLVHRFVGASFSNPNLVDDQELATAVGDNGGIQTEPNEVSINVQADNVNDDGLPRPLAKVTPSDYEYDRKKEFVIDFKRSLGPASFISTKPVGSGHRIGNNGMAAIVIREEGAEKFAKLLRSIYIDPESIQSTLNTWVAVVKPSVDLSKKLFLEVRGGGMGISN